MRTERSFRNYLAGAALAFGVVLLTSQILQIAYGGLSPTELDALLPMLINLYLIAHIVGGLLGGFLVARTRTKDFIMLGTVVGVTAYVIEFIYNIIIERTLTDIYAAVSLILGAIVGAMFYRSRIERAKIQVQKEGENQA